jgi:hypothetical protein
MEAHKKNGPQPSKTRWVLRTATTIRLCESFKPPLMHKLAIYTLLNIYLFNTIFIMTNKILHSLLYASDAAWLVVALGYRAHTLYTITLEFIYSIFFIWYSMIWDGFLLNLLFLRKSRVCLPVAWQRDLPRHSPRDTWYVHQWVLQWFNWHVWQNHN